MKYSIKPFLHEDGIDGNPTSENRPHIVKRMTDVIDDAVQLVDHLLRPADQYVDRERRSFNFGKSSCGLNDLKPHVRWTRGITSGKKGEQIIETLLMIDQKMAQYYGIDAAKQYALTVANVAHDILRDSTVGPNMLNLIITKLIVLTSPLDDLTINHHARNSLASFGKWANRRNKVAGDHYDYSVLLTKHDICVDRDQPCETKGLSYVGGMCDFSKSAAIIEDDGFGSAFTIAHQTGHSLGMDHDGVGNICDNSKRIMATNGGTAADAFHWSQCSVDYLQQFLRKPQSKCLDNDPPRAKKENIDIYRNPGTVYDADQQCKYAIGQQAKACYEDNLDETCVELLCFNPEFGNCSRIGKPAMDGTPCGNNKWCKEAICIEKGVRDDLVVDGGWTEWSGFLPCSRSCGGGVSYRERECQSPKPKHGGKYCEGEARMYVICQKEACPAPAINYRRFQCENQSSVYDGDQLLNWTYNEENELATSCELKCESTTNKEIWKMFGYAKDGTPCAVSHVPGRCIHGECNTAGCNLVLGSTQLEDRCGVCGGDGSSCKDQANLSSNALAISRIASNKDITDQIAVLEEKKKHRIINVEKKLSELRSLMKDVIKKKCNHDLNCVKQFDVNTLISKKGTVEEKPGKFQWVFTSSGCSVSCGRGIEMLSPECRRLDDSTSVANVFCEGQEKKNVITKACTRAACPPSWTTSGWSACTRSCGEGGRKIRNVYCVLNVGNEEYVLPVTQCNEKDRPKRLDICNVRECPPQWYADPYGRCSTSCGVGKRVRDVVCRKVKSLDGSYEVVSNTECPQTMIPERDMTCNAHNPCPGNGDCGGMWTDKEGIIKSPHYPEKYDNSEECVHEIIGKPGQIITLGFDNIDIVTPNQQFGDTKCYGDFLRVTDGKCSEVRFRPSVKFCGKDNPGVYTSTGNNLCLKFVSDQSEDGQGFSLRYKIQEKREEKKTIQDICDIHNQVINAPLGVITSPNYPLKYPRNEECKIIFNSPDKTGYMLKFDRFQVGTRRGVMDCTNDYLKIFYEDKTEKICGMEPSIPTINIPTAKFVMTFHSSALKVDGKGFVLTFVTKFYAKEHARNNKTANYIQDYKTTLSEWQSRRENITDTSLPDMFPNSAIKKSAINKAGDINNREELMRVLIELSNGENALPPQNSYIETNEKGAETRTLHPILQYQFQTPITSTEFARSNIQLPIQNNLPQWNYNPVGDNRDLYSSRSNIAKAPFQQQNIEETLKPLSNKDLYKQRNFAMLHQIYKHSAPGLKRYTSPQNIQQPPILETNENTENKYKKGSIPHANSYAPLLNNIKPGAIKKMFTIPSKLKNTQNSLKSNFIKPLNTGTVKSNYAKNTIGKTLMKPPVAKQHKMLNSIWNGYARSKLSPVKTVTQNNAFTWQQHIGATTSNQNSGNVWSTYPAKQIQASVKYNVAKSPLTGYTTATNNVNPLKTSYWNMPYITSPFYNKNTWKQENAATKNKINQPNYYGTYPAYQQQYNTWSHRTYQPMFWRQGTPWAQNTKRQYQSLPFLYPPNFGIFNNHCPPKATFSCRSITYQPRCMSDKDCVDLRLGCCETNCNYAQRVCIPKG